MYNTDSKENTKEKVVKGMYILLPRTFAVVVTSAVRGTMISSVV
jgi:hypothetical protein